MDETITSVEETTETETPESTEKTFTQAEVQSQIDAVLSKRISEEKAKNEQAIKDALAEYERQAQLTAEERDREARTKQEALIRAREDEITLREQTIAAKEQLNELGMSSGLVDFVVDLDPSITSANVARLAEEFNRAVEAGVTAKLTGTSPEDPRANTRPPAKGMPSQF